MDCSLTENEPQQADDKLRFGRLSQTRTFGDGGLRSWSQAVIAIIGAGLIGGRLAFEAVLSGVGEVLVWDFDRTEVENLGNQFGQPTVPKVTSLVERCNGVRLGHIRGFCEDIRHAGIRVLTGCDLLVDCSDDPRLAWSLTQISNGLNKPMLRPAVDGSGELELGRVLCSSGGAGGACQLCTFSLDDLKRHHQRMHCPNGGRDYGAPTLAGGPMGATISSLALLQAQRLVTGNDRELVVDREIIVDFSHFQLLDIRLERSERCLSGHRSWELADVDATVGEATLADLFDVARGEFGTTDVTLAGYQHSLNVQAACTCGNVRIAAGTEWAKTPVCNDCRNPMQWLAETQIDRINQESAAELRVLNTPLAELGYPDGAMFSARSPGKPVRRLLLR